MLAGGKLRTSCDECAIPSSSQERLCVVFSHTAPLKKSSLVWFFTQCCCISCSSFVEHTRTYPNHRQRHSGKTNPNPSLHSASRSLFSLCLLGARLLPPPREAILRRRVRFPLKRHVLATKISGNNRKQGSTNNEKTPENKKNNEAFRVPGTCDLRRCTSKYHGVSRPRATPLAPCGPVRTVRMAIIGGVVCARPGQTLGFRASHPTNGCAQIKPLLPAS